MRCLVYVLCSSTRSGRTSSDLSGFNRWTCIKSSVYGFAFSCRNCFSRQYCSYSRRDGEPMLIQTVGRETIESISQFKHCTVKQKQFIVLDQLNKRLQSVALSLIVLFSAPQRSSSSSIISTVAVIRSQIR